MQNSNIANDNISMFLDHETSIYVQRSLLIDDGTDYNEQIKLISLLNAYGAKFSSYKVLLYDIEMLNKVEEELVHLPSNLFHPDDHVSFDNIRMNVNTVVPIKFYLKCVLYLFKLNLPTMFLRKSSSPQISPAKPLLQRSTFKRTFRSMCDLDGTGLDSQTKLQRNFDQSFINDLKLGFANNFHELIKFVQKYVIDRFESNVYYSSIQEAFELLANLN
jgi:hypothetical protein